MKRYTRVEQYLHGDWVVLHEGEIADDTSNEEVEEVLVQLLNTFCRAKEDGKSVPLFNGVDNRSVLFSPKDGPVRVSRVHSRKK